METIAIADVGSILTRAAGNPAVSDDTKGPACDACLTWKANKVGRRVRTTGIVPKVTV